MARTKTYALERGGPKRLAVKRRWFWRNTEVSLDGAPLGPPIRNMAALKAGQTYRLSDGRTLGVGFERSLTAAGVSLTVDGRPVPGAANDPRVTIRAAGKLLWVLAAMNLTIGLLILSLGERVQAMGAGFTVFGGVMAALGFAVYFRHSRVALAAAIVIECIDGFVMLALMPQTRNPPVGAIVFRVLIVIALIRAYQAVERARKVDRDERIDQAFS
jgi:hypothetical protein